MAFNLQRHFLCRFWFVVKIHKFHNPKYESSKLMFSWLKCHWAVKNPKHYIVPIWRQAKEKKLPYFTILFFLLSNSISYLKVRHNSKSKTISQVRELVEITRQRGEGMTQDLEAGVVHLCEEILHSVQGSVRWSLSIHWVCWCWDT